MASEISEAIAEMIVERQRLSAEAAASRRAVKAQARADHAAARKLGLTARHTRKLARSRTPEMLF